MALPNTAAIGEVCYDGHGAYVFLGYQWASLSKTTFPHCDQNCIHRPLSCEYCDQYASDLQHNRELLNVNFTGENDPSKHPCPSDLRRGLGGAHGWGGNAPRPNKGIIDANTIDYNGKCPKCGADAYIGFNSITCSKGCK